MSQNNNLEPKTSDMNSSGQLMDKNQLKSLGALISYVSHEQNVDFETVKCIIEAKFGVDNIGQLKATNYDDIVRFIVDFRIDRSIN